jgi:hypothetical protein
VIVRRLSDGSFEAGGLLPGTYRVEAACSGYVAASVEELELRDRELVDRVWEVRRGGSIRGHVRSRGGTPLADVEVRAHDNAPMFVTRSYADGRYELSGLPPGDYGIDCELDGAWLTLDHERVTLAAPGKRLQVTLGRGVTVPLVLGPRA